VREENWFEDLLPWPSPLLYRTPRIHHTLRIGRCYLTCSEIFLWDLLIIFYRHYNLKMLDDMLDELIIFTQSSMGLKRGMCSNWTWTFGFSSIHLPTCMDARHHYHHLGRCIHACCRRIMVNWALLVFNHPSWALLKITQFIH
jgi:hypothetical protein